MSTSVRLPSRTGDTLGSEIEVESDGSITILTEHRHGYRSAHRDYAQQHFGEALWCMHRLTWLNKHGFRVVLTRWNTQKFRTTPMLRTTQKEA